MRFPARVLGTMACLFVMPLYAQTFQPGGELVIRDSAGRLVGQFLGGGVSVVINGHPVILSVQQNRLTSGYLWFDQPNCQGNAYLASTPLIVTTQGAFAPDGTVRISPSSQGTTRTMASRYYDAIQQCVAETSTFVALSTETGPNLQTMFTAPFSASQGVVSEPVALSNVPANSTIYLAALLGILAIVAIVRLK